MADRATQIVNFYESTLAASLIGASGVATTTLSQAPTTDGTATISASSGDEDTWYYLVVDPDTSGTREVIVVKASSGTTISEIGRDVEGRYASTSLPEHTAGTTVRMAALAEHIKDQNDRVTTNISSLSTAITNFNTNSAAAISTFNTDGATAIAAINASSATAMMANATDGTAITVDNANDYILVYDNDTSTAKQVNLSQLSLGASVGLVLALGG